MKLPEPKAPAAGVNVKDPSAARATEPNAAFGCDTSTAVRGEKASLSLSLPRTPGAKTVDWFGGKFGSVKLSSFAVGGTGGSVSVTVATPLWDIPSEAR